MIEKKLIKLFYHRIKVDIYQNPELRNENLFGHSLAIPPREAVILLLDIENTFNVEISSDFILSKGFTTFQKILNYLKGDK